MFIVNILIMMVGGAIFWEDVKTRSVHWVLFPLFTALLTINSSMGLNFITFLWNTTYNILFVVIQLMLLTIYVSVKNKKMTSILAYGFGLGDVLLLVSLCFYFSFLNYLAFYIISLLLVIVAWALIKLIGRQEEKRIPLAGIQAIIFIVVFLMGWINPALRFNNDDWLLNRFFVWM